MPACYLGMSRAVGSAVMVGTAMKWPATQLERGGGDGGIRTLDTLFKVCSFSKRVPSAARPRLHAPDMPDDAVTCKPGSARAG